MRSLVPQTITTNNGQVGIAYMKQSDDNNSSQQRLADVGSAPRWLVGADDGSHAEIPEDGIAGVFDNDDEDDDAVCVADESVEVEVAMDSGAVDHVINPEDLPGGAVVKPATGRRANRNFTAANGTPMTNYGEVDVVLEGVEEEDDSMANGTFAVTNVTRALHAASRIADDDCSILITKTNCQVFKGEVKVTGRTPLTTYRRKGGLYVRRVKLRAGRMQAKKTDGGGKPQPAPKASGRPASGFTRPGTQR